MRESTFSETWHGAVHTNGEKPRVNSMCSLFTASTVRIEHRPSSLSAISPLGVEKKDEG
jgi:hypothetical protein